MTDFALSIETLARIALLWTCAAIVVAVVFGRLQGHGRRRYRVARRSLGERHIEVPKGERRLP